MSGCESKDALYSMIQEKNNLKDKKEVENRIDKIWMGIIVADREKGMTKEEFEHYDIW